MVVGPGLFSQEAVAVERTVTELGDLERLGSEAAHGAEDEARAAEAVAQEGRVVEGVARGAGDVSAGADQSITIYRGTSRPAELAATRESGYAMSDAARTAYVENRGAGASLNESLQSARSSSEAADARQLTFWGSRNDYVQAHAAFGTEFQREIGIRRSMISFTTDPEIATRFAGRNGAVFSARVPVSAVFPQTLPGAAEEEVLVLHLIQVEELP